MRRLWMIALVFAVLLAIGALIAPQAALDEVVVALGLDQTTSLAHPPLGQTARFALAAAALVTGLLLAALLRRGASRRVDPDADVPIGRGPLVAEPSAPRSFTPRFADVSPEPVAAMFAVSPPEADDVAHPEDQPQTLDAPAPAATAVAILEPVTIHQPGAAHATPLERIEATLARLEARGPDRLDAIDARLGQMAQQLAELAALARAVARTPTPVPLVTPGQLRSPADQDQRRSIGAAARALRASLGSGPDSA